MIFALLFHTQILKQIMVNIEFFSNYDGPSNYLPIFGLELIRLKLGGLNRLKSLVKQTDNDVLRVKCCKISKKFVKDC